MVDEKLDNSAEIFECNQSDSSDLINYYVDESGDFTLFNKRSGLVNAIGCSKTIMLGLLKVKEEKCFNEEFNKFSEKIMDDPIFNTIPSFRKKTKFQFHAKDDHVLVREKVFHFIAKLDISIQVGIRRKSSLIESFKTENVSIKKRISDKQIYEDLVSSLFKRNIHKADRYKVFFSNRGKTFSNNSLTSALQVAKQEFINNNRLISNSKFNVICSNPSQYPGLQIIDYCLWALQRLIEKEEDAYFNLISDKFKLIVDVDDQRSKNAGAHYTLKNRISLAKLGGVS